MLHCLRDCLVVFVIPLIVMTSLLTLPCLQAVRIKSHKTLKTQTFLSPLLIMEPGLVVEKFFYDIDFPRGHIALKSFNIEIVDEEGNSISLFETYLHHWGLTRYYQHKDARPPNDTVSFTDLNEPDYIVASNSGVCQKHALPHFYGTGAESRQTSSFIPDPYGIEVGNLEQVPLGYYEKWLLNVHAIDTREVENKLGCIECWCYLYNVTKDKQGMPLDPNYKGGFRCCFDKTQCRLGQSYGAKQRNVYARYTVKWVDWDDLVLPVSVYIFDITDTWKPLKDTLGHTHTRGPEEHKCLVEYDVESCSHPNKTSNECNATKKIKVSIPNGGYLVYGFAHQHIGGIGSTLYGEDGRVLCSSSPIYGRGNEVGNENGYVVGMSTCYPKPGSLKIKNGEILSLESKYDQTQNHIGVMGIFHIMVAQKLPLHLLQMEASWSQLNVGEESSLYKNLVL